MTYLTAGSHSCQLSTSQHTASVHFAVLLQNFCPKPSVLPCRRTIGSCMFSFYIFANPCLMCLCVPCMRLFVPFVGSSGPIHCLRVNSSSENVVVLTTFVALFSDVPLALSVEFVHPALPFCIPTKYFSEFRVPCPALPPQGCAQHHQRANTANGCAAYQEHPHITHVQ